MLRKQHRHRWLTATLAIAGLALVMSAAMPSPADAHDRRSWRGGDGWGGWDGGGHRHRDRHRHRGWDNSWGGFFYAPQPRYFYQPQPRYYQPPPYAYQPYQQPYGYGPPPTYFYTPPPSLDFYFRF
jgi:hypothetical protein